MIFTNLTRGNEIGANSYLLDFEADGRIVLDAGMHPRGETVSGRCRNWRRCALIRRGRFWSAMHIMTIRGRFRY